jgi:hypothetical protein
MDGPHAGEPTTERGEIERLARACQAAAARGRLGSTVIETRFNVVRSSVPHRVATVRRLRDYLRPEGDTPPSDGGRRLLRASRRWRLWPGPLAAGLPASDAGGERHS